MGFEEMGGMGYYVGIVIGVVMIMKWALKSLNIWFYERHLDKKIRDNLPPGDLGWPLLGNMLSFLRAFKSTDPNTFITNYVQRYGPGGVYKSFMFGNPSIIVTVPEACKKAMFDDDTFEPGWPKATLELIGRKSFVSIDYEDHKRLRKLTAAPVNGHDALSVYMQYIEANVVTSLESLSNMGRIEFLTQLRKLTFKIIMHIFLSVESGDIMEALEKEYTTLNYGVRAMAINIPGFVYHKALKARKNLVAILQAAVTERRKKRAENQKISKKDMLDNLLDARDDIGKELTDEEIIDTLVMYLNAGHESSGHVTMWATILLQEHPEYFKIAKEEQEKIVKNMPPGQKGLTLKEYRQMEYLSKVIDETLRIVTFSSMTFRQARKDTEIKGYAIPKGWKVLVWFRSVHHNPEIYPKPDEFNPSRWDDFVPKPATFLPFGAGTRLCPGNDLAKLEIAIFLHHFLLGYEFQRENPACPMMYLPHSRPTDNCLGKVVKVAK